MPEIFSRINLCEWGAHAARQTALYWEKKIGEPPILTREPRVLPSSKLSPKLFIFVIFIFCVILKAETSPSHSIVVRATDRFVLELLTPKPERVRKLFNAALLRYTATDHVAAAWKKIIKPHERIGIKIQTEPGAFMSTRSAVVETIIEGLELAGVSSHHIIIFDRYGPQMELAGYKPGERTDGVHIQATVPNSGYDPKVNIDSPIPGKLIWGDFEFKGENTEEKSQEEGQLSTKSYFSRILTEQIDKVINVGVVVTDPNLGLYGCQLNASLSMVDNFRRFQKASFSREDSISQIFGHPMIQKKCVLHVLDALLIQYAGGPTFDPHYCWPLSSIYLSRDPVALDSLALQHINEQRPKKSLPLFKEEEIAYLRMAEELGLGVADLSRIDLQEIRIDH